MMVYFKLVFFFFFGGKHQHQRVEIIDTVEVQFLSLITGIHVKNPDVTDMGS